MTLHQEQPPDHCPRCGSGDWGSEGTNQTWGYIGGWIQEQLRCQLCDLSIVLHYVYHGWETSEENP